MKKIKPDDSALDEELDGDFAIVPWRGKEEQESGEIDSEESATEDR